MDEPLLSPPTTTASTDASHSPSAPAILTRLAFVLVLTALSVWAHHEAAKGFDITVLNSSTSSHAGRRFDLMFVSNGRAARAIHDATRSIELALFPDHQYPRKPIGHVTVRLATHNLTDAVSVVPGEAPGDYVINLSPSLMSGPDVGAAVDAAVRRGMAWVWLWDGQGAAPPVIVEALVEHLAAPLRLPRPPRCSTGADTVNRPCWATGGEFVRYCEERRRGFVARLNRGMREQWSDRAVDVALGEPSRRVCAVFRSSAQAAGGHTEIVGETDHVSWIDTSHGGVKLRSAGPT